MITALAIRKVVCHDGLDSSSCHEERTCVSEESAWKLPGLSNMAVFIFDMIVRVLEGISLEPLQRRLYASGQNANERR